MTELTLFTFIGETITNATNAFMVPAANDLMLKLQMAVLAGVTLYIVMSGYAVATGSMESPFWTVMKQWAKIIFIGYFAFTVDGYHEKIVGTLSGIETGLSDVLRTCSKSPWVMRSSGDEKELSKRHQPRTIRSHQAAAGKCAQKNQSPAGRPVRGVLCGAVPTQERLPVAHAARRIS